MHGNDSGAGRQVFRRMLDPRLNVRHLVSDPWTHLNDGVADDCEAIRWLVIKEGDTFDASLEERKEQARQAMTCAKIRDMRRANTTADTGEALDGFTELLHRQHITPGKRFNETSHHGRGVEFRL